METLFEQIDHLSIRDTKTLSQKGLKAVEEVGELAKAILPYEGAHGTNHRVPCRDKIVEECADVMLVAYSIMKSLGCDPVEIRTVVQRKTDYWQFLLDNEDKADLDNLDFEVHLTVKEISSIDHFINTCRELSVKPIILDLYAGQTIIKDIMTSSTFRGTTKQAVDYTKSLARQFKDRGFAIMREKIETVPWHPAAQVRPTVQSNYFEAHFGFKTDFPSLLKEFCQSYNIHLSRNKMKTKQDSVLMGTYRISSQDTNPRQFQADVQNILFYAHAEGHEVVKLPRVEYSLVDSNESHDSVWINSEVKV